MKNEQDPLKETEAYITLPEKIAKHYKQFCKSLSKKNYLGAIKELEKVKKYYQSNNIGYDVVYLDKVIDDMKKLAGKQQ